MFFNSSPEFDVGVSLFGNFISLWTSFSGYLNDEWNQNVVNLLLPLGFGSYT